MYALHVAKSHKGKLALLIIDQNNIMEMKIQKNLSNTHYHLILLRR